MTTFLTEYQPIKTEDMTRLDEIKKKMLELEEETPNWKDTTVYVAGFMDGAMWADQHPHWISVEEQDIPLGQWVITYAPNEDIYCNIDVELLAMDETAEDFGITHWLPLPQAPKKGE